MMNRNLNFKKKFVNKLFEIFSKQKVVCVLYFGSARVEVVNGDVNDLDIYICLNSYAKEDLGKLRLLANRFENTDIIFQWKEDLPNSIEEYRFGNHGAYLARCLTYADTWYGVSSFPSIVPPKLTEIEKVHLFEKAAEYFVRLDRVYISRKWSKIEDSFFRKYSIRICMDILLAAEKLEFSKYTIMPLEEQLGEIRNSGLFPIELTMLVRQAHKNNSFKNDYPLIRQHLYAVFQREKSKVI